MGLDSGCNLGKIPTVHTLITDNKRRVRIPDAKPGQVWAYEIAPGVVTLTEVKKVEPKPAKARLVKSPKGYLVFRSDRVITAEETRKALDEFP
jgi:hypothetical protein